VRRPWWLIAGLLSAAVCAVNAQAVTPSRPTASSERQATASPLEQHVTLDLKNVTLAAALNEIARQGHLDLSFTDEVVPSSRRITIKLHDVTAREAIERVLRGTSVQLQVTKSGSVVLVKGGERRAEATTDSVQYGVVWGHVADSAASKALVGTEMTMKGTDLSVVTNADGNYLFQHVPFGVHVITARYFGYAPETREVAVVNTQITKLDFALRMGMTRLQEIVTTASGPRRRYELGNDITILNVDSIVATQPISSVTDLLEGRVPGLTVQHTSGAPGDPSRLRLRGTSSILRGNDPILIVDGIRVYYAQSDSTSANLASTRMGYSIAAPSPLDQLDPNAIETIEVMKGPSAATLYGPDAANGVIVITTKRGRAGPARWTLNASRGTSYMPGNYPLGIYRWGHDLSGVTRLCPLTDLRCQADSLVRFQALNHSQYSPLGHGRNTSESVGVSGGSAALTYAITGSYDDETGILTLPAIESTQFQKDHGGALPPDWMQRPQQLTRWSGTSRLTATINDHADASLSTTLTRESQQRSTLEQQIATLMTTYIDSTTGTYMSSSGTWLSQVDQPLPDFYQRSTDVATNFTNAANFTWRPLGWLTTSADGGINVIGREDDIVLPRGMLTTPDSAGRLSTGHGSTVVTTVNLRATATVPLPLSFHLQLASGANYTKTSLSSLTSGVSDLAPGTTSINGAGKIEYSSQAANDVTSFGWYLEPSFTHRRFTISTGLRLDASSSFGANVHLAAFPKLGGSWLISEEPFFPFKHFFDVFRVRAAYGRAGVWPGEADQLRLYTTSRPWLSSGFQDALEVSTIGNSQLRPERSTETEGGFDADLLSDRLSIGFSGYRKMRYDAIMPVPVAPSIYGMGIQRLQNIGVIRNTGVELNVTTQIVRTAPVTWSTTVNLSRNHNMVTELGAGVVPFGPNYARVVAGYPLFGRWAKPILGYADVNHNGVIERNEVELGDTLVFMGSSEPNYEANLFTTLSLFRGAVTASAGFSYQNGLTQLNQTIGGPGRAIFSPGTSDPSSSFGEQAAVAVMNESDYGLLQTVNTLRLNSVSLAYNASPSLAGRFGAKALSIALQGTNMGLWTNYAGKDPNVNAFATGNAVMDTGVLPIPRLWLLTVHATY